MNNAHSSRSCRFAAALRRRRFAFLGLSSLLLLLSLCFTACIGEDKPEVPNRAGESAGVGRKTPQFSVKMSDKSSFSSQLLLGRRAVIVFFFSKCSDCHRYLLVLNRFYESVRADAKSEFADVQFLCIGRADDPARVAQFWATSRLSLPYAPETDRKVFDLFGARRVPTTYVQNAQGVCVAVYGDDNAPDAAELQNALRKAK